MEESDTYISTIEINHNNCTIKQCNAYSDIKVKTDTEKTDIDQPDTTDTSDKNTIQCQGKFCTSRGVNLGDINPRQLCQKIYCPNEPIAQ